MEPTPNKIPKHIGIILDGNRRFAKRLMMKPWKGHEWGAKKLEKVLDWAKEFKIEEITFYTLSEENLNRPKQEFDFLMDVFRKEFTRLKSDPRIHENKIKINFIGRLWKLPEDIQKKAQELMELTKDYNKYIINFTLAYSGRSEVIDATRKISQQVKEGKLNINEINEKCFSKNIYLESEPDLVIRTGGEKRTSNFLLWQSNYAEWIFLEKMWPEFEKQDFIYCLEEYSRRQRRFGK